MIPVDDASTVEGADVSERTSGKKWSTLTLAEAYSTLSSSSKECQNHWVSSPSARTLTDRPSCQLRLQALAKVCEE